MDSQGEEEVQTSTRKAWEGLHENIETLPRNVILTSLQSSRKIKAADPSRQKPSRRTYKEAAEARPESVLVKGRRSNICQDVTEIR